MQDAIWCEKTGDAANVAAQRVQYSHGVHLLSFLQQKANDYYEYVINYSNVVFLIYSYLPSDA